MLDVIVLEVSQQFMKNYNYLIVDRTTKKSVIVDPAWEIEKIEKCLHEAEVTLEGILITHSHADHIHLCKVLAKRHDCPIWMSHIEIANSSFTHENLMGIGEQLWNVGNIVIKSILTPGHTVGCICYLIDDNLFTGDVLFAEGCGLCVDTQAAHAMFASLDQLKNTLKPDTRIFPGHSYGKYPGQTFANVLKNNIYLQFSDKDTFARFRLRSGQSREKIFDFH